MQSCILTYSRLTKRESWIALTLIYHQGVGGNLISAIIPPPPKKNPFYQRHPAATEKTGLPFCVHKLSEYEGQFQTLAKLTRDSEDWLETKSGSPPA